MCVRRLRNTVLPIGIDGGIAVERDLALPLTETVEEDVIHCAALEPRGCGKVLFVDQQTKPAATLSLKRNVHIVGGVRKEGVPSANDEQFIIEKTTLVLPTKCGGIEQKCVKINTVLRFGKG